ncbi:hypothetical protein IFR05_011033 [Cadophora sp. M221]|nr:hypothetical protein IFR05_011033 [Cadophora sp. M221]
MPSRRAHKKSRLGCQECSFTTAEQSITTFDLLDLTLMNHFTAVTALTMFSGEKQRLVWQTDIHLKARSNRVLMHGILSVAAIHLALLEPENWSQYRLRALHHHDLGVRLFNQQLANITPESAQILFPFAVMLVVWAYASPIIAQDALQLDDIFDLLELARGCKTIFFLHWDSIKHTSMASIADLVARPGAISHVALRALESMRHILLDSTYDYAISRLEHVFMRTVGRLDDVRSVVAWPCLVDEEVWKRLRVKDTEALFLFAHYAMLLERYERQWWWINGCGGNLATVLSLFASTLTPSIPLTLLLLTIPVIDQTATVETSWSSNANAPWLTPARMTWYRDMYLTNPDDSRKWTASPNLAPREVLAKSPPVWMGISECDILYDEGKAYAELLRRNGVEVECVVYPGSTHSILSLDGQSLPPSWEAINTERDHPSCEAKRCADSFVLDLGKKMVMDASEALAKAFGTF